MIILILILLGLCFGSFVNAWVWRLHEQSKPKKKRAASDEELSVTKGRSMCPHCKHTLGFWDLLPVISWLSLGRKCRYCRNSISWQYPFVEIFTAVLFVVSYQFWPADLGLDWTYWVQFGIWLIAIIIGMALAIYDVRWMLLPNRLVVALASVGGLYAVFSLLSGYKVLFIAELALAIVIAGGIFWLLFQISNGKWIGGGDVKLGLTLGLFLITPDKALLMLFMASLLGTVYAGILVLLRKYHKGSHIPFGPFLIAATYFVVLFGARIADTYTQLFLI